MDMAPPGADGQVACVGKQLETPKRVSFAHIHARAGLFQHTALAANCGVLLKSGASKRDQCRISVSNKARSAP
jgi:hypothetical protein